MKASFFKLFLLLLFANVSLFAQNGFNYQSILKNSNGEVIKNSSITLKFTIKDSSASSTLYQETQDITTPSNGVINIVIGAGTVLSGSFSDIDWSLSSLVLQREVDLGSGSYVDFGSTTIQSVPISNYAKTTKNISFDNSFTAVGESSLSNAVSSTSALTAVGYKVLKENTTGAFNSGFGNEALINNTTGSNNTALGVNSLRSNQTSNNNTGVGYNALSANTGFQNVAVGSNALSSNITGNYNTALGYESLSRNTSGNENLALGQLALGFSTSGGNNTAVGSSAGESLNTVSDRNTFIGSGADTTSGTTLTNATAIGADATVTSSNTIQLGDENVTLVQSSGTISATAFVGDGSGLKNLNGSSTDSLNNILIGNNALADNTDGTNNVAIGLSALTKNTMGDENIAIGRASLMFNTTGEKNNAFGDNALVYNLTGSNNTAFGNDALKNNLASSNTAFGNNALTANTSGTVNTAVGNNALESNTIGEGNTAIGYNALSANTSGFINVSVGQNTLEENTTGTGNTAVGYRSGQYNTTGGNNTFLGNQAKTTSGSTISNATAIGANAEVSVSNKIRLGDTNVSVIEGQVGFTAASDRRLKEQISKTKYGLETLLKLVPVDYLLKSNGLAQIGFIAQDLKPLVPEAVNGTEGDIEKGETLGITYTTLIPILTKAIQEQQSQIDSQAKQIKILLQRIEVLEKK
jgi:carbonic anhydrase/acetyltransferase-like protein (isoleucine patch superfamily)